MVPKNWAPGCPTNRASEEEIGGGFAMNVQDFMQSSYISGWFGFCCSSCYADNTFYALAMCEVAKRIKHCSHVLGFDCFNEPSAGFIGKDITMIPETVIPPGRVQ